MAESAAPSLPFLRTVLRRLMLRALIPLMAVLLAAMCASASDKKSGGEFPVPPPPFTPGIFPCSACHEGMEADTQKRELGDAHGYHAPPRP